MLRANLRNKGCRAVLEFAAPGARLGDAFRATRDPYEGSIARRQQEPVRHELFEHHLTRFGIELPQPARLREREPQPRHFCEFAAHTTDQRLRGHVETLSDIWERLREIGRMNVSRLTV